jgi:hypothetical protein
MAAIDEAIANVAGIKDALADPGQAEHEPSKHTYLMLATLLYIAELLEQIVTNTTPE